MPPYHICKLAAKDQQETQVGLSALQLDLQGASCKSSRQKSCACHLAALPCLTVLLLATLCWRQVMTHNTLCCSSPHMCLCTACVQLEEVERQGKAMILLNPVLKDIPGSSGVMGVR